MRSTIICVDDEKVLLNILMEQLESWFGSNYLIEGALSGEEALEVLDDCLRRNRPVSVFISDYMMPNMKGDELLEEVSKRDPAIKKIMLTGYSSIEGIIKAINKAGLYRYIQKPWDNKDLMLTLLEAIKSYENEKKTKEVLHNYEALYHKYEDISKQNLENFEVAVQSLAIASDMRGFHVEGHYSRVAKYAMFLGKAFGFDDEKLKYLKYAAHLHDVGNLALTDEQLMMLMESKKTSKVSKEIRKAQVESARKILDMLPIYNKIEDTIEAQFEEHCGGGPFGLAGDSIPLSAQILYISNYFDFIKNKSEPAYTFEELIKILEESRGILFSPKVLDTFISIIKPSLN